VLRVDLYNKNIYVIIIEHVQALAITCMKKTSLIRYKSKNNALQKLKK